MADAELISFRAEMSAWKADIAKMTGQTEAEVGKQLSAWVRMWKAQEQQAKTATAKMRAEIRALRETSVKTAGDVGESLTQASTSGKKFVQVGASIAQQMPDVATQLASGTSAVQVFTQQGLQVAQVHMSSLLGLLASPWGLAMAGAVAAISVLANEIHETRMETAAFRESVDGTYQALEPSRVLAAEVAFRGLAAAVADSQQMLLLATGALESEEVAQMAAVDAARAAAKAKILETATRWSALEVQRQEIAAALESGAISGSDLTVARARLSVLEKELPAARERLAILKEQVDESISQVNANYNLANAHKAVERAAKDRAKTEKEISDEQRYQTGLASANEKARADLRRVEEGAADATIAAKNMQKDAELSILDPMARVNAAYQERLDILDGLARAGADAATVGRARLAVEQAQQKDSYDAWMQQVADKRAAEEKAANERAQHIREAIANQERYFGAYAGLAATTNSTLMGLADLLSEKHKKGAMVAFKAAKAAAMAEAIISGFAGAARAFRDWPWPYSIGVAAIVAAQAGVQVAAIAATEPSFGDTPRPIRMDQGGSARFAPGDTVIAAKDPDDLARQAQQAQGRWASSRGSAPSIALVEPTRHWDRWGRDALRSPGAWRDAQRQTGRTPGRV